MVPQPLAGKLPLRALCLVVHIVRPPFRGGFLLPAGRKLPLLWSIRRWLEGGGGCSRMHHRPVPLCGFRDVVYIVGTPRGVTLFLPARGKGGGVCGEGCWGTGGRRRGVGGGVECRWWGNLGCSQGASESCAAGLVRAPVLTSAISVSVPCKGGFQTRRRRVRSA